MSCLGEPPPPTPPLFSFDRDIKYYVEDGLEFVGTILIFIGAAILLTATAPLWGLFWIIGYLTK